MKVLMLDQAKCTGCRACEYACSFEHTGRFNPLDSRIKVNEFWEDLTFVPSVCLQCERAYCEEVCPTSALTKNSETGVVELNKEKCIGCKQCIVACPWGSIKLDHTGKEVIKCDNCGGDPACIKVCYPGALSYEEVEDITNVKVQETATRLKEIAKDLVKGGA
ncbi:MAG: 4Fe-4S dicluster domain-containing protein [Thermotogota bacterium]|nr:4Fe-4S dicluster domain-containing protein [Thermotogota bacterium]